MRHRMSFARRLLAHTRKAAVWVTTVLTLFAATAAAAEPPSSTVNRGIEPPVTVSDLQPSAEDQPMEPDVSSAVEELETLLEQPVLAPALEQEVTTVTRQPSTVGRSPAAVFVITNEMIRRSGAQTIAEALRLVPGLQVARIDGNKWAISSRGLNGRFANHLLVQIDGRSVYTPVFAGTYWDVQDVVLEDIDRIEVIRGPGATIWGANAVNGVINIITKNTRKTVGVYAKGGGGTEEEGFSTIRVGGQQGDLTWRVYSKWFDRGPQFDTGNLGADDWHQLRGGLRMDWSPSDCDLVTVQGDIYDGKSGSNTSTRPPFDEVVEGGNVLARWTHTIDDDSDYSLQTYYDATDRNSPTFLQHVETVDVDFQHRFPLGYCHNAIWGLGYRRIYTSLPTGPAGTFALVPTKLTTDLYSAFIQDEITLSEDRLYLTLGTKLEKNYFTDVEVQPSTRLLWLLDNRRVAWGSISRAVRTPARIDRGFRVPLGPFLLGPSPGFDSEELIAYEIGYRAQPTENFSWDLALSYNVYEDLQAREVVGGGFPIPVAFANEMSGDTYGVEISGRWQVTPCWSLSAWYSFLQIELQEAPTLLPSVADVEGESPHNQAFLMSSWDIGCRTDLDLMLRYVDELPAIDVPSYLSLDLRLGWHPTSNLELSVVGQNLLDHHHPEFDDAGGAPQFTGEIRRGVYGQVVRRW